jgi:hypothetical protein
MPTPDDLTTLSDLVRDFGRDVRYWSGYVSAMRDLLDTPIYRGPNNSIAIDRKALARIAAKFRKRVPVPEPR